MNTDVNIILDKTDLQILRILQDNARISNADLARELGLAPSGVLERVKKLEQKNVILQYNARINPVAVQQKLLAFIFMTVSPGHDYKKVASLFAKIEQIQEVHQVAGDDCYLLKVRTCDTASLMELMRTKISKIPNLLSTRTTIVLETVKEQQGLTISEQ
jgi:Lrp/AsnC family leucine-responsive transcriptional regulator